MCDARLSRFQWSIDYHPAAGLETCPRCRDPLVLEPGLQPLWLDEGATPYVLCDGCADDVDPGTFARLLAKRAERGP